MGAEGMACGENAERLAVVRIDRNRLFQQRLCDHIVLPGHPPVMRQRPHHQIPGIETAGRLASSAKIFGSVQLWLNCCDDRFGDLVLNSENVGKVAVVTFRPRCGFRSKHR